MAVPPYCEDKAWLFCRFLRECATGSLNIEELLIASRRATFVSLKPLLLVRRVMMVMGLELEVELVMRLISPVA